MKSKTRSNEQGKAFLRNLTMKRASGATCVEPAVGTTAAHLAIVHHALRPRPMALAAVLARLRRCLARHMGKQRFHIAAALNVELLVDAALDRLAQRRLSRQLLAHGAVNLDLVSVGGIRHVCGSPGLCIVGRRMVMHLVVVELEVVVVVIVVVGCQRRVHRRHDASIGEHIDGCELIASLNWALDDGVPLGDGRVQRARVVVGVGIGRFFGVLLKLLLSGCR